MDAGARTLKEAVSAAIRDWVANVESTHYVIGSCVGPAPYPALVRDLQRRIGDEARAQLLDQAGRLPDRAVACVGGGSNAIGTFIPFVDDEGVELIGVEAAGEGLATQRHSAPLTTGARGVLHGALTGVIQDEEGQILEAHSISAGLDYPGVGSGARLAAGLGARALRGGGGRRRAWMPSTAWRSSRASCRHSSPRTRSRGCWRIRRPGSASSRCPGAATRISPRCSRSDEHRSPHRGIRRRTGSAQL